MRAICMLMFSELTQMSIWSSAAPELRFTLRRLPVINRISLPCACAGA
jgi:hypothetical protein